MSIVNHLKRSLVHSNSRILFYWLWFVSVECLSWSVTKKLMCRLMVGLSFKRERVLKQRGRESWRVLRVLFSESTAAIIIHKSSSSSLAFLSIYRGAEASGRVGWSWGIVLSPLCFTTFLFSLVWAPSGALHHSHGHEVLGGFPVMVTLLITLHLWILSSAVAGKSAVFLKSWCLAWPWNVNTISCLFFFFHLLWKEKGVMGSADQMTCY